MRNGQDTQPIIIDAIDKREREASQWKATEYLS
jgi:hypothetical protein